MYPSNSQKFPTFSMRSSQPKNKMAPNDGQITLTIHEFQIIFNVNPVNAVEIFIHGGSRTMLPKLCRVATRLCS